MTTPQYVTPAIRSGNPTGSMAPVTPMPTNLGFGNAPITGSMAPATPSAPTFQQPTPPGMPASATFAQNNVNLNQYTPSPYLGRMAQDIGQQATSNYTRNIAPSLRSGAMAAGGFGGSRQGVVEANALRDLNTGVAQNITNLYGTDYSNQMNRNLQQYQTNAQTNLGRYQADQSYNLGLAGVNQNRYATDVNANVNRYQTDVNADTNRYQIDNQTNLGFANLDSNNQQFGANYGLNYLNAQNQWAQNAINAANQIQNTPINYFNGFNNNATQIAGQGSTATGSNTNQGNPYMGAIGGALTANSLYGAFNR